MSNISSIVKIFREFISDHPRSFFILLALLVLEGVVAGGTVLALVPFADFMLDSSLENPSRVTLVVISFFSLMDIHVGFWSFGLFFVCLNIINGIMRIAIRYTILRIKYTVLRSLFADTLKAFFKARWEFFSGSNSGVLMNTMNKELVVIGDVLGSLATQLAQAVQLSIYLIIPFWLDASMTIICLGLAFLFGLPFIRLNNISYKLGVENTRTANIALGILSEIIQSARIILGFGRQKNARLRYLEAFDNHMTVSIKSQALSTAVPSLYAPLGMLAAVIALGISVNQEHQISELAAVMWSLLSALPIISLLMQTNIDINSFIPSYEQLLSLRKRATKYKEIEGMKVFKKLNEKIDFKNVHFSHHGRKNIITGLDLCIKKGGMTALVGESGSGKSTITDLILGLQLPDKGEILIDGVPLKDYQQNSYRQRTGYVPQEPILFHNSIRENLLWASDLSTEKELWNALQISNAAEFVKVLPHGIDTIVGDRGIRLSGGQRQRIALARALLRNPELLILDEATSALDTESEIMIQDTIDRLSNNMTMIVVAHRLSTIKQANQVIVLQSGKVVEQGSYADLSTCIGGFFYSMLQKQNINIDDISRKK